MKNDKETYFRFIDKHLEELNKMRELVFEILDDAVREGIEIEFAVSLVDDVKYILQWSLDHKEYRKKILKRYGLEKYFEEVKE